MSGIRYLPAALILLAVAGLATKNLTHYPVGIMSLLGIWHAAREPKIVIGSANARFLIGIFLCLWLPMLFSLTDAISPSRAIETTAAYFHFLPAGLYMIYMLRDPDVRRIVLLGLVAIVMFWCVDGVIQLVFGKDLFGYPYDGSVLKGVFYPKQRFGLVVSVFAPLVCYAVLRFSAKTLWAWLALAPLLIVVTFSLKRTAWIMLFAGLALFATYFVRTTQLNMNRAIGALAIGLLIIGATVFSFPKLHTQITDTLDIFSADFETADVATSHRLSLWKTGLSIAEAHPINGIGPRGYRTIYREFAAADDFWIARGNEGQTHPHLMALEVLVETGVVGLIGYALCLAMLAVRSWRQRDTNPTSSVLLLVAFVAWFPLNAHLAFYGSYWANIAWITISLGCSSVATMSQETA